MEINSRREKGREEENRGGKRSRGWQRYMKRRMEMEAEGSMRKRFRRERETQIEVQLYRKSRLWK